MNGAGGQTLGGDPELIVVVADDDVPERLIAAASGTCFPVYAVGRNNRG